MEASWQILTRLLCFGLCTASRGSWVITSLCSPFHLDLRNDSNISAKSSRMALTTYSLNWSAYTLTVWQHRWPDVT